MNDITSNKNLMQNKDFRLVIDRLPNVEYFCTRVNIPTVTNAFATSPSPFTLLKIPGDALNYSPLIVTFRLDEDLKNYEEVLKWMEAYAFPHSYDQYKNNPNASRNQLVASKVSDMTIFTSSNLYNSNVSFVFEDAFPTDISDINLEIDVSDVNPLTVTVGFAYTKFTLQRAR